MRLPGVGRRSPVLPPGKVLLARRSGTAEVFTILLIFSSNVWARVGCCPTRSDLVVQPERDLECAGHAPGRYSGFRTAVLLDPR